MFLVKWRGAWVMVEGWGAGAW